MKKKENKSDSKKVTMPEKTDKEMVEFTKAEKYLQAYLSVMIMEVFHKCDAYKCEEVDEILRDTERMQYLIMNELPKDLVPNIQSDKMAQSVHKRLVRVLGSRLNSKIREQDPDEERSIIATFQMKLLKHSGKPPKTMTSLHAIIVGGLLGICFASLFTYAFCSLMV